MNKIICLDETSVGSALKPTYSRCELGRRCVIKTSNQFVFRKFTLLVAISNSKCVGKELYEKGGMTKERLLDFLEKYVFSKYNLFDFLFNRKVRFYIFKGVNNIYI